MKNKITRYVCFILALAILFSVNVSAIAPKPEIGSDFAVSCCTMLRGFIDRKNSCRSITARTIGAAGGYRHSLSNRG